MANKRTREFKIETGTIFKDNKRDLIITDREYRMDADNINRKYYKYTCNKCGWDDGWAIESSLLKSKTGCSCCANQVIVPEINSIYTKAPWMMKWISEEDAKKYAPQSNRKVEVKCLDCGRKKQILIANLYKRKTISCTCGDGVSYPEKILHFLLNVLTVKYINQLSNTTFNWCDKYRYDFYIPDKNTIIEIHGGQHYFENTNFKMNLTEVQENDRVKKELALANGVEHYIVIDCRESTLEWIKNNILESKLNELFDLSQVDWLKAEEFALKNIIKEVCEYWNNKEEWETTQTITDSNKWGVKGVSTIRNYLKKGTKLGWCNYNPKAEIKKKSKSVEVIKDNKSLGVFPSVRELERQSEKLFGVKLNDTGILKVCNGISDLYKSYKFKFTM